MELELDADGRPRGETGAPGEEAAAVVRRSVPDVLRLPRPAEWTAAGAPRCAAALVAAVRVGVPSVVIGGVGLSRDRPAEAAGLAWLAAVAQRLTTDTGAVGAGSPRATAATAAANAAAGSGVAPSSTRVPGQAQSAGQDAGGTPRRLATRRSRLGGR